MRRALILLALVLALPAPARALDAPRLTKIIDRELKFTGADTGVYVEDLDGGVPVYARDADLPRAPASVQKLFTTAAAQAALGDGFRFTTAVLTDTYVSVDGTLRGDLFLRGAGDPTLSGADLRALAGQVRRAGILRVAGRVVGDETAFDRRRGVPSSGYAIDPDVQPLGALMVDRGFTRGQLAYQAHPAVFAAKRLADALRARGVAVGHRAAAGRTGSLGLAIAWTRSPPLRVLLKRQNVLSDNYIAETLLKTIARSRGGLGTTARGAILAHRLLADRFRIDPTVIDGSGLSRLDATTPREVVALLTRKIEDPTFVRSLPIVGQTGTVAFRARTPLTFNQCRAKTGTLSDVSALAGYCGTADGGTVAFAILNNNVDVYVAHLVQDKIVEALVRYDGG